jgi:hypothetical protein
MTTVLNFMKIYGFFRKLLVVDTDGQTKRGDLISLPFFKESRLNMERREPHIQKTAS